MWRTIVTAAGPLIGPSLMLQCRHKRTEIKTPDDFKRAPQGNFICSLEIIWVLPHTFNVTIGGCMISCDIKMACGHTCKSLCHNIDAHPPCADKCNREYKACKHLCSDRCHFGKKECRPCTFLVSKVVPTCGHRSTMPCHIDPRTWTCRQIIQGQFPLCGHADTYQCYQGTTTRTCHQKVTFTRQCGCPVDTECCDLATESIKLCTKKCNKQLKDCEHKCPGQCGQCHQAKQHQTCKVPCSRELLCGHPW
jgi:hypothetical protein